MTKVAYLRSRTRWTEAEEVLTSLHESGYTMMTYANLFPDPTDEQTRELEQTRQLLEEPSNHVAVFRKGDANQYIVAIRGTNWSSWSDLWEDINVALERSHLGNRVAKVRDLVHQLARFYGNKSVTITGHSLGAIVGYNIERELYLTNRESGNNHLQLGHYFNLPFIPLDIFLCTILCRAKLKLTFLRKATISFPFLRKSAASSRATSPWWIPDDENRFMSEFNSLVEWSPHIYVQRYDTISQSILNYFENRQMNDYAHAYTAFTPMMVKFGARALQHLPSARFIIASHGLDTVTSHRLSNWITAISCDIEVMQYSLHPQPESFSDIPTPG
jgi:hypothetical protein